MPQVELIFDMACPNVDATRASLRDAFAATGIAAKWREFEVNSAECPSALRHYGSPTVLVDGRDVADDPAADADCCRIYLLADGTRQGAPPSQAIVSALRRSGNGRSDAARSAGFLTALPTVGIALLPKLTCPLCWPAYAALLSAFGLGFVDYTPYLPALTVALLLASLASLGVIAWRRGNWWPLLAGLVGGGTLWFGRFLFDSEPATYVGIAVLAIAPWIPALGRRPSETCLACAPDAAEEVTR